MHNLLARFTGGRFEPMVIVAVLAEWKIFSSCCFIVTARYLRGVLVLPPCVGVVALAFAHHGPDLPRVFIGNSH